MRPEEALANIEQEGLHAEAAALRSVVDNPMKGVTEALLHAQDKQSERMAEAVDRGMMAMSESVDRLRTDLHNTIVKTSMMTVTVAVLGMGIVGAMVGIRTFFTAPDGTSISVSPESSEAAEDGK
jgi:phosphoglycerate dehydrogenase-like enzyme